MNAWLKSILKRPFIMITIAFLVLVHGGSTYLQVPIIASAEYSRNAFDLSVTAKWRYGYVVEHHGAFLVKARNIPETVPYLDPGLSEDKELASAMSRKLETYPLRAALEALFYSFLVGYALFLVPWLRSKFAAKNSRYSHGTLFEGAVWALGWTLACLPLICFGYGSSLFSTWAGPGASGYSGPYPGLITGLSGETITYRPLLEGASIIPMIAVEATGLGRCLPEMTMGLFVWISGVLFYCTVAFLVWGAVCLIDALVAKHNDRQN
ncbi:MAG: hypothetical protein NT178_10855 [Proteobacteria bacterium]|nr:hypothetical protein [Pseudomonadota bacterium]